MPLDLPEGPDTWHRLPDINLYMCASAPLNHKPFKWDGSAAKSKKIGFDITNTNDPIYVLLPKSSEYIPLIEKIYTDIINEKYRF